MEVTLQTGDLMQRITRFIYAGFGIWTISLAQVLTGVASDTATSPIGANQHVLILGDSIAAPGMYSYVANEILLAAHIESPPIFSSFGIAGATSQSILPALSHGLENGLYDWILVNLGQNDSGRFTPDEFKQHSRKLLATLREKAPHAKLGWISLLGSEPTAWADDPTQTKRAGKLLEQRRKCAAIAAATRELCEEEGILYVPLFECVENLLQQRKKLGLKVSFTMDSIHPNLAGYWVFGAALMKSLGFAVPPIERDVLQADALSDQGRLAIADRTEPLTLQFDGIFLKVRLVSPPTDTIISHRRTTAICVDGNVSEWSDVPDVTIAPPLHVTMECVPGAARADRYAASLQSAYDEENLYFAVRVREPATGEGKWFPEIVEIFIDARQDTSQSGNVWRKTPGLTQYCFHRDFSGAEPRVTISINGDDSQGQDIVAAAHLEQGGYAMEIAVPVRNFKQSAFKSGLRCPMDWAVSFTDQAVNLDWMGLMSRSCSTRGYGWLILE